MTKADTGGHWTLGAIGQEALLNFAASWPLSIILVTILAGVIIVPAVTEAGAVETNLLVVADIETGGGNVLVATAAASEIGDTGGVDARVCESLQESPSVVTSGSVGAITTQTVLGISVASATTSAVSPGALKAMWSSYDEQATDLVVPRELAVSRGLYPGSI
ncbi:MAG: hypothetical protein QNL12_07115, partial [Acidimicrobiia bacterium]|nr:hypothetical protein [Acidimicrobiia bacterium]